jgi:hypothetical protein
MTVTHPITPSQDASLLAQHDQLAGILNDSQVEYRPGDGQVTGPGNDFVGLIGVCVTSRRASRILMRRESASAR